MIRYSAEVLEPTSVLPRGSEQTFDRESFERVWALLEGSVPGWHRSRLVDLDGGLFVKGLQPSPEWSPQQLLRRWHIRHEFRNLVALRDLDIEKPVPVAWGCESRFGLPVRSFLLQRAISGGVDFSQYIRVGGDDAKRLEVFRAVGEMVHTLHSAGWIHGDLACRNLLVRPEKREVVLVDLARVKRSRPDRIGWRRRKELYRLVKSADKCGASPSEVEAMMQAASGAQAAAVIQTTRQLRSIDRRSARKLRTWYWRITGRQLGV